MSSTESDLETLETERLADAIGNVEPMLRDTGEQYVFRKRDPDIYEAYVRHSSTFWQASEVSVADDLPDWERLTHDEKHFIKYVLAFFAGADGIVVENLAQRFMSEITLPEARFFYGFQLMIENVHCVVGNTRILTDRGYYPIGDLYSKESKPVRVWNGSSYAETKIKHTSPNGPVEVIRVCLSNGHSLTCTPGHKWLIPAAAPTKDRAGSEFDRVTTVSLGIGQVIAPFDLPIVLAGVPMPDAYELGMTFSAVTIAALDDVTCNRETGDIPFAGDVVARARWLTGVIDGYAGRAQPAEGWEFVGFQRDISELQLLIQTLGTHASSVAVCDTFSKLMLSNNSLSSLRRISDFTPKRLSVIKTTGTPEVITVVSKEQAGLAHTYCFTEPIHNCGVFDGVRTGQCEVYSDFINMLIRDTTEREALFNAIRDIPCIARKADWALRWVKSQTAVFAERLVAFAVIEGIFFSGAFCSIYWLQERNLMPALGLANKWIARDEALHTEFAVLLYGKLVNKLPCSKIHQIITEAVGIEIEFITVALPCSMVGINAANMVEYIKFVADRLCVQLGYPKIYGAVQPFKFMEQLNYSAKANFFEKKSSAYGANVVLAKHTDFAFDDSSDEAEPGDGGDTRDADRVNNANVDSAANSPIEQIVRAVSADSYDEE